jgi:predicted CoA-substrate-specific enzyme activase
MESTKGLILRSEHNYTWSLVPGGRAAATETARKALCQAADDMGIAFQDIGYIAATGIGKEFIDFVDTRLPEPVCLAAGIHILLPTAKTLLDLGAKKNLVVRCGQGKAMKWQESNKCASGSGTFLKMVANILATTVENLSSLAQKSTSEVEIQSTCAVFAESEIISLVHDGARPEDIAKGVFRGLAARIYTQLLETGMEGDVVAVGGGANIRATIDALQDMTGTTIRVPCNPELVGALGAAIIGMQKRNSIS